MWKLSYYLTSKIKASIFSRSYRPVSFRVPHLPTLFLKTFSNIDFRQVCCGNSRRALCFRSKVMLAEQKSTEHAGAISALGRKVSSLAGDVTSFGSQATGTFPRPVYFPAPCGRNHTTRSHLPAIDWPGTGKSLALALTSLVFHPALGSTASFTVFGKGQERLRRRSARTVPTDRARPVPVPSRPSRRGCAPLVPSRPPRSPPAAACHRDQGWPGPAQPAQGLAPCGGGAGCGPGQAALPGWAGAGCGSAAQVPGCPPQGTCWAAAPSPTRDIPLMLLPLVPRRWPFRARPARPAGRHHWLHPARPLHPTRPRAPGASALLSLLLLRWRYKIKHSLIYIIDYSSPACWAGSKKADDDCLSVAPKTVNSLITSSHLYNYFCGFSVSHTWVTQL